MVGHDALLRYPNTKATDIATGPEQDRITQPAPDLVAKRHCRQDFRHHCATTTPLARGSTHHESVPVHRLKVCPANAGVHRTATRASSRPGRLPRTHGGIASIQSSCKTAIEGTNTRCDGVWDIRGLKVRATVIRFLLLRFARHQKGYQGLDVHTPSERWSGITAEATAGNHLETYVRSIIPSNHTRQR